MRRGMSTRKIKVILLENVNFDLLAAGSYQLAARSFSVLDGSSPWQFTPVALHDRHRLST